MFSKWHRLMADVTVEPSFFFSYTAYIILYVLNTNLYLQKSCRFNITSEPDLDTPCDDEKQGVLFASQINSEYRFAMLVLCILYTILWTCWSDEAGRRRLPLIYLPIISVILQSSLGLLNSYVWELDPIIAALSEMACEVISGGIVMMLVATRIYIGDVSTMQNLTMRLGILAAVKTLADSLSNGSAGFILRAVGFFYSYLFCLVLSMISLILALIFVRDVSVPVEMKQHFLQFFNLGKVVGSFKVVFKKSLGKKRSIVGLLLVVYILVYFTTQGEKAVFYLYFRYRFQWDERQYGVYVLYKNIGIFLGTLFCSVVLSKQLKLHDGAIGMFVGFWDTVAVLCYLFANRNWQLYGIPLLEVFHDTALLISQSFISKYYTSSEFGRLYAAQSVFGLIIPFCLPAYNIIFQKTIEFFPAAFFSLSVFLDVIIFFLYGLSYLLCRKFNKQPEITDHSPLLKK